MLFSLQKCCRYNSAMVETVLHLRKERTALSFSKLWHLKKSSTLACLLYLVSNPSSIPVFLGW